MYRVILLTLSMAFLGACTSTPDIEIVQTKPYQPFPAYLLVDCDEYAKYTSGDMREFIINHTDNMEKAINCKNKHNKLVEVIKEREKTE